MSEMNTEPMGEEEEKKPFFRTPLGIILIVVAVLIICCCLALVIIGSSAESIIEGLGGMIDDPEFQRQMEELQMTLEAAE